MKINCGDYIIATKTVRGHCKIGIRYEVLKIVKKGEIIDTTGLFFDFEIKYDEDEFLIMHNNNFTYSKSEYFIYDYKYNRTKKLKKLKLI